MGDAYGVEISRGAPSTNRGEAPSGDRNERRPHRRAAHIGVIDEHLAPVREVETQSIGIAEGKEVDLCDHEILHRVRGAWHLLI